MKLNISRKCVKTTVFCEKMVIILFAIQMVCDAKCQVTSVNPLWPGSVHDISIFYRSKIYDTVRNISPRAYLVGDKGYSLGPYMIVPFKQPLDPDNFEDRSCILIDILFDYMYDNKYMNSECNMFFFLLNSIADSTMPNHKLGTR